MEIYAVLQADEDEAKLDCGCVLERRDDDRIFLYHCHVHHKAIDLNSACMAVLHQLKVGEASEGDKKDIAWCAKTLERAI